MYIWKSYFVYTRILCLMYLCICVDCNIIRKVLVYWVIVCSYLNKVNFTDEVELHIRNLTKKSNSHCGQQGSFEWVLHLAGCWTSPRRWRVRHHSTSSFPPHRSPFLQARRLPRRFPGDNTKTNCPPLIGQRQGDLQGEALCSVPWLPPSSWDYRWPANNSFPQLWFRPPDTPWLPPWGSQWLDPGDQLLLSGISQLWGLHGHGSPWKYNYNAKLSWA